ncbi:L,D-transpeptidase [Roseibacillus ishigakijimensis]|uniref:L,D-transpeptidase n=1 Tax=Roseibacillus ishigakijimensis TaxID=454146 RepID=A0A934RQT2_9BACT|nr:L,D-transpeptidase [Roseibacillus ishigakijimensis]MBK1832560.1 L,D-transpeptidase [Roseibacillus ishigakijimensis]
MTLRAFLSLLLPCSLLLFSCSPAGNSAPAQGKILGLEWSVIDSAIAAQRQAGHPDYNPQWLYLVDPASQRLHVVSLRTRQIRETLLCGTGKRGLGTGDAQTPPGFFTMGGVRIAHNGDPSIQTGDSKKGVSGIYAEMLYPPSHPDPKLRGMVPNGVVIHSYNPTASEMLRQRRAQRLVGRVPCTTGCPVPEIDQAPRLIPYLKASAGRFDPTASPNANLRALIASGKVVEYQTQALGDPIYVLNRQ